MKKQRLTEWERANVENSVQIKLAPSRQSAARANSFSFMNLKFWNFPSNSLQSLLETAKFALALLVSSFIGWWLWLRSFDGTTRKICSSPLHTHTQSQSQVLLYDFVHADVSGVLNSLKIYCNVMDFHRHSWRVMTATATHKITHETFSTKKCLLALSLLRAFVIFPHFYGI